MNMAVVSAHFVDFGEEGEGENLFPSARCSNPTRSEELASCDGAAHGSSPACRPCVRTFLVHDNLIRISCALETHSHNVHFFVHLFRDG